MHQIKVQNNPEKGRQHSISSHDSDVRALISIYSMIQEARSFNNQEELGKILVKVSKTSAE